MTSAVKIPKRIDEIIKRKQELIDLSRETLNNTVVKLQSKLLDTVVTDVITELDVKDGVIQDTAKNYQLISKLNMTFERFKSTQSMILLKNLTSSIDKIVSLNQAYFTLVFPDLPERFEKVILKARELTDLRFGLKGGKFVRGGILDSVFSEFGSTEVKQIMSKAVASQMDLKEFIRQMRGFVAGTPEKMGISERKFKQFAFDVYQQYDRTYSGKLAEEFEMRYFLYQGGLVVDSRDFCAAHNNKVWSVEEAESWKTWTPDIGEYPPGYEVKAKIRDEIPSYIDYPGYMPLVDLGGYNCRHSLGYISDELAFKLRPELAIKALQ
jgi:hypothetical protein